MKTARVVSLFVALLVPQLVLGFDECVPLLSGFSTTTSGCIGLINSNYPDDSFLSSVASSAASFWGTGCDSYGYYSGISYPAFSYGGCSGGGINISIAYQSGGSTNVNGSCADFTPSFDSSGHLSGGTILTYQYDYLGQACSGDLTWVLEHEMGHALGLGDAPSSSTSPGGACFGRIMGNHYFGGAGTPLQGNDCITTDSQWTTPTEEQGGNQCSTGNGCTSGYVPPPCSNEAQTDVCGCCLNYSPLIVDLGGHGIRMSSPADGVIFDINGFHDYKIIGWPAEAASAWLALDRNHDGRINNGSELFGNTTPLRSGHIASTGFEALAELDENHDSIIDSRDPMFAHLVLWIDRDRDGFSEPQELVSLTEAGVISISLRVQTSARRDQWGNRFEYRAKVRMASPPFERFLYDVYPSVLNR